jgi:small-conductance mechanosensitive channel
MDLNAILETEIFHFKDHSLSILQVATVVLIFVVTRVISFVLKFVAVSYRRLTKSDVSHGYPVYQVGMYFIWVVSIVYMLEALGIDVSLILAGGAALLVAIGLGLQQLFHDALSGLVLLFERSVRENDILEIDGDIVKIQKIGFRTSLGMNRNLIVIVLPNSVITSNKVINWSNQTENTRFGIDVSVAYGSDVEKVIDVLELCAADHPEIRSDHVVEARLTDFAASGLDFKLLFFSDNVFQIERIKSEVRRIINREFIKEGIVIPFQQLDVNLKPNAPS